MIDMTYDPEIDAAYIYLGRGEIDHQEEVGPFTHDVNVDGRIIGIEILSASQPGAGQVASREAAGRRRSRTQRNKRVGRIRR